MFTTAESPASEGWVDPFEEWMLLPDEVDSFGVDPPDAVARVLGASTMESVFAAERLVEVDGLRREMMAGFVPGPFRSREVMNRSIRLELACALRITEYAAARMLDLAEALVHRYPAVLDAMAGARITQRHAELLVDEVDPLPADLRAEVAVRALVLAEEEPVGTFRRALRRLVETVQAATLEERHRAAVADRRVVLEPGQDGAGALHLYGPLVELHAIHQRITGIAGVIRTQPGESRTLDQVRADVMSDLLIDGTTEATPVKARGIRASVVVTVPVLALLDPDRAASGDPGVGDPAVVEGVGPIPISTARELCGGDATWMRVLTHPETGMVLSVGRDRYETPGPLRKLTKWRADRCMGPGCGMPASRCEIDHTIAWADGGHTCLDNHCPFCKGHHVVKHHGDWLVEQIEGSGGAVRWTSPTGRVYIVKPERAVPTFTVTTTSSTGSSPSASDTGSGDDEPPPSGSASSTPAPPRNTSGDDEPPPF